MCYYHGKQSHVFKFYIKCGSVIKVLLFKAFSLCMFRPAATPNRTGMQYKYKQYSVEWYSLSKIVDD